MSKKVIGAAGIIAVILIIVLATIVPKAANARKAAEQLHLGDTYLSELEYDQAEAAYLAVIEIDPKNVDAYLGLAEVYLAQGKYDEAIEILEQALDEIGDNEEIKKKLEEAEQAKKVAEVTPEPTATPIPTPSPEPTATSTPVPTVTNTPAPSPEPTATSTPTPSPEPTVTSTPTPSPEPTATSTPTPEPTATSTPTPTSEPTATSTPTPIPSPTSTPTPTPVQETSAESFEWKEKDDGTVEITKLKDKTLTEVVIPKEIEGKSVTSLGRYAFQDRTSINSIVIPASVTSIGDGAFYRCSSLSSISVPNGVTEIPDRAFYGCLSLTDVSIADSVTKIGKDAFFDCNSLETLVIPAGVKVLGGHDGKSGSHMNLGPCNSLKEFIVSEENEVFTSVNGSLLTKDGTILIRVPWGTEGSYRIPDSVIKLCYAALSDCSKITEIVIPKGVKGGNAFYLFVSGCSSLERFTVESGNSDYSTINGVLANGTGRIIESVPAKGTGTVYTIPEDVIVNRGCFENCADIEKIIIPGSVGFAFASYGSNGYDWDITEVNRLMGCRSLKEISIAGEKNYTTVDGVMFTKNKETLVAMPGGYESSSYTVPDGVANIGHYAFEDCGNMTSIVLPDSLEMICTYAFVNCTALTEIAIPESVTVIGVNAFSGCKSLTKVELQEGLESIQDYAFSGCFNLKEVVIPASVKELGRSVFQSGTTLIVQPGSYAESWAIENGYNVVNP